VQRLLLANQKRFVAASTNRRILIVARSAKERIVSICERHVSQLGLALRTDETFVMPVSVLEENILRQQKTPTRDARS
jgi:hypothetical protein